MATKGEELINTLSDAISNDYGCDVAYSSFYKELCDVGHYIYELEKENEILSNEQKLRVELEKTRKALDKACNKLSSMECGFDIPQRLPKEWKEWCLKDE